MKIEMILRDNEHLYSPVCQNDRQSLTQPLSGPAEGGCQ